MAVREFADEWDEDGDDRWIVCDVCNQPYHLQYSGIQYPISEYRNDIDFECDSWMILILNVRSVKDI